MWQLLSGVSYIHQAGVIHRDLKPQNLLVSSENLLKIADFGLAFQANLPLGQRRHGVTTLWYRAPEVILEDPNYDYAVDIWAVGCIMAEIIRPEPFFNG